MSAIPRAPWRRDCSARTAPGHQTYFRGDASTCATTWAEYGARIGYAVTEAVTFDVFVSGVSGDDDIDTRVHGGAGLRYRF